MPRRIMFVINSLGPGGAERALTNILAARPARKGAGADEIHLVLLDTLPDRRPAPPNVILHRLDGRERLLPSLVALFRLAQRIRPHLMVSLLLRANLATAVSGRLLHIPTLLCERMHVSSHLAGKYRGLRLRLLRCLPALSYRLGTRLLAVSQGVADDMVLGHRARAARVSVINNPFDLEAIRQAGGRPSPAALTLPPRFAVAMGRLEPAKNMQLAIDAFLDAGVGFPLVIIGEGSLKGMLENHVAQLGAGGAVRFLPYQDNPFAILSKAEFYLSASRNEGFPNAMMEAMALGVPVVATDCPSGPAEIAGVAAADLQQLFTHAPYALLVPMDSRKGLSLAMKEICRPSVNRHYRAQARARSRDFALQPVAAQYWREIDALAQYG